MNALLQNPKTFPGADAVRGDLETILAEDSAVLDELNAHFALPYRLSDSTPPDLHGLNRLPARIGTLYLACVIRSSLCEVILRARAYDTQETLWVFLDNMRRASTNMGDPNLQIYCDDCRNSFIDQLMAQYGLHEPDDERRGTAPWQEDVIRSWLKHQIDIQHAVIEALQAKATKRSPGTSVIYFREVTKCQVFERFLHSQHLATKADFLRAAKLIKTEAPNLSGKSPTPDVRACWAKTVAEMMDKFDALYGDAELCQT